jgi:hypothetical protein
MNTKEVEQLLEKFFNGETSLIEENRLRDWFKAPGLPTRHLPLKAQFEYFSREAELVLMDDDFEDELFKVIHSYDQQKAKAKRRKLFVSLSGIAASLLLAVVLFMQYKPAPIEDSFNDPALAYQEIQKALFFVSEKLNMGLKPAQKAAHNLNEGIEQTSRISKLYEVQNFFINE